MSLNSNFLQAMSQPSVKTNVVVVFSPRDTFYGFRPFQNRYFDGSRSYILWKREPDLTERGDATIENQFKAFLDGTLPAGDVPLECIDTVSLDGSTIDVKGAQVEDDGVTINVVLKEPQHKSFFQSLIGYNVEVYFGFSEQAFNFYDYEQFYVGKLNGLDSDSNLTLALKVGTLADFWNKTWVHSRGLTEKTKTAYPYPLPKLATTTTNQAAGFGYVDQYTKRVGNRNVPSTHADFTKARYTAIEYWFKYAVNNVGAFGFDYHYRWPRDLFVSTGVPLSLSSRYKTLPAEDTVLKTTSAIFFQPTGSTQKIQRQAPEYIKNDFDYPDDEAFMRARLAPTVSDKVRFRIGDVLCESNYIDVYVMWPLLVLQARTVGGTDWVVDNTRNTINVSPWNFNRSFVMEVERVAANPEASQSSDANTLNSLAPLKDSLAGVVIDHTSNCQRDSGDNYNTCTPNIGTRYTSLQATSRYFGHMNRWKFATKLKFFTRATEEDQIAPEFDEGSEVTFYDTDSGIGDLQYILLLTLRRNLGINNNVIDSTSFIQASNQHRAKMDIPLSKTRIGAFNIKRPLSFDYSFDGSGSATDLIQEKILKSNNLRMVLDGGVLRTLFVDLQDKPRLTEMVNNEEIPFLISEDDILESTTYNTRFEDQLKRIKLVTGFRDDQDNEGSEVFYAIDERDDDGVGEVRIYTELPDQFREDDFEEIELAHNLCDSDPFFDEWRGKFGFVGQPYHRFQYNEAQKLALQFAKGYFTLVNPSIKLNVTTGARGLQVKAGDIIDLRDHKAFELFGSQYIKAFVLSKSIEDWGTSNITVSLELLYIGKSLDYVQARIPTAPKRLRLVSTAKSRINPAKTVATLRWDEPSDWGQAVDRTLYSYKLYEVTSLGDRLRLTLPAGEPISGEAIWSPSNRELRIDLENDSTYRFYVKADNGVFESPASNILEFESLDSITAPSRPTNLRITGSDRSEVSLAWDAAADFGGDVAVTYNVYVDGEWVDNVGSELSYSYNFVDNYPPGETIQITVSAMNQADEGEESAPVAFTIPQPLPVPEGVITLTGTAVSTSQIDLTWSATITRGNEGVEYDLYRSLRLGDGGEVIDEGITEVTLRDTGLDSDTTYFYKVVARNASGDGVESPQVEVKTFADVLRTRPQPPTGFRFG